jgi:PAS domain S-box-containing protein
MTSWRARQSSVAYDQAQRVSDWLKEREGDAQVLSANPAVRAVLSAHNEAGQFPRHPSGGVPGSLEVLDKMAKWYSYAGVYILDRDAHVVMPSGRSIPLNPLFSETCRVAAQAGVARTELVGDAPTRTLVGFIAPVLPGPATADAGQRPGQPLGVVLLVSDAAQTLFPMVVRNGVPTRTGETLLVRREGNAVFYFSPLRHVPAGSLHLRSPLSTAPLAPRLALQGRETVLEYSDYRSVPVLAATQRIPRTGWGLVRKIDRAEAMQGFRRTAMTEELAGGLSIVILLGGLWLFHRREVLAQVLKQEEERFRALLESAPDAMVVINRTAHMVLVNSAMERLSGYAREELLGEPLLKLTPERFREERAEYYARLFSSPARHDQKLQQERWGPRKDGSEFPVEVTFSTIEMRQGTVMAIAVRDITERKRAEEERQRLLEQLRALAARLQSIREEERKRVAREIYDQLGQALTAIKIDFSSLLQEWRENEKKPSTRSSSILNLLNESFQAVHRIATELRPGNLDDLGLVAAIEWAGEDFQARTGTKCRLDLPPEDIAIDPECATAIFRIFQETLTNVAQHARASEVRVRLAKEGGELTLEVHDNGKGIPEDKLSTGKSLGILGMRGRAILLGGELAISGLPGNGTTVRVRIPQAHRSLQGDGHDEGPDR